MDIQKYVDEKKELYEKSIQFIENDEFDFSDLMSIINSPNIQNDHYEFESFLHMIKKIAQHHHRNSQFFYKIETILTEIEINIKQTFSNIEIFNIFKSDKLILLFLIEKRIISIDKSIFDEIQKKSTSHEEEEINEEYEKEEEYCEEEYGNNEYDNEIDDDEIDDINIEEVKSKFKNFKYYFYPEIKNYLGEEERKQIEEYFEQTFGEFDMKEFLERRKIGENNSYICQLIRQDSVEDFITYINQNHISISSQILPSIFETNSFLIDKYPTLIEYACFFGSIQIIKYLLFNNAILKSSLWNYSIHSNNAELIHLLEEYHVKPLKKNYYICLEESIKCHHNEIAQYIYDNLIEEKTKIYKVENNYYENIYSYSFHYYDYSFFPSEFDNHLIFLYLCKFNYIKLVKLLLNNMKIDINYKYQNILNNQNLMIFHNYFK